MRYQKRISGPLLDRIDIHVEVPRVDYEKLAEKLLKVAMQQLHLSAHVYHRVLKLACTIADLEGGYGIAANHVAEAIQYRSRVGML
jgi:magnesium chelatase family protein